MRAAVFATAVAVLSVGGAAQAADKKPPPPPGPLIKVLTTPVDVLAAEAAQGKDDAQYALAIVRAHGLRDTPRDEAEARTLKAQALAARAPLHITTYMAGLNGAPGRVVPMIIPQGGLPAFVARQTDACVAALERGAPDGTSNAAGCGGERFETLAALWAQAQPWKPQPLPSCDSDDPRCRVLRQRVANLNARSPRAEALAAAARGDFRLAATNFIGPEPSGWSLPGVSCTAWKLDLIGKWHVNQDVIRGGDGEHTAASLAFMRIYNGALVADPAFPYRDICTPIGLPRAPRYEGPVRTAGEAARSGDLAKLAALDPAVDVNAVDPLGKTALNWATERQDEPMAKALLMRGADPNLHDPGDAGPLALALENRQTALADLMLAKGARPSGMTGLCDFRGRLFFQGPDAPPENRHCSWPGLLVDRDRFDVLDAPLAAGVDKGGFDAGNEIRASLLAAIQANDKARSRRLLAYLGATPDGAASALAWLRGLGREDLVRLYVAGPGAEAARSPAEARIWRAAAEARRDAALDFLQDYGADLNLLPAARLTQCEASARQGDEAALLACVQEAGQRRLRIRAALEAGDTAAFNGLVAEAADLRERGKATLLSATAIKGTPEMLEALIARGAGVEGGYERSATPVYKGALKPDPALGAPGSGYLSEPSNLMPVVAVAMRGDARGLRMLVDAGAKGLPSALQNLGNLGNPPPGLPSFSLGQTSTDTSGLPSGPGADKLKAMDLVATELARTQGPQALEPSFASATYSGYDDVLALFLAKGFDPSKAKEPEVIWFNWSGLGNPCKPSTGRLLARSGLPVVYPPSEFSRWPALHTLAAGCFNADSVAALLDNARIDVNAVDENGRTAVDQARLYRRSYLEAALRARGGKSSKELDPARVQRRKAETAAVTDMDLSQAVED